MKTYTVKTPITHSGEDFQPGDEIELKDEQAELLLGTNPPAIEDPETAEVSDAPVRAPKKVAKKAAK